MTNIIQAVGSKDTGWKLKCKKSYKISKSNITDQRQKSDSITIHLEDLPLNKDF